MQQVEWRRYQVLELSSKGHNQSEISRILQIDKSIISRDVAFLREQSRINIRKYVENEPKSMKNAWLDLLRF
jgi:DNA-binding transcriptional regulator LsrR (DeoR family)